MTLQLVLKICTTSFNMAKKAMIQPFSHINGIIRWSCVGKTIGIHPTFNFLQRQVVVYLKLLLLFKKTTAPTIVNITI